MNPIAQSMTVRVRKAYPTRQGLKPPGNAQRVHKTNVRKAYPTRQGLKRHNRNRERAV